MEYLAVSLIIVAVHAVGRCPGSASDLVGMPEDWTKLDAELRAVFRTSDGSVTFDTLRLSKGLRWIAEKGDRRIWLEMITQELPLVQLAGFFCIKDRDPSLAFRASLEIVMHQDFTYSEEFYAPVYEFLKEVKPAPDTLSAFSSVCTPSSHEDRLRFDALVRGISHEFLHAWFHDRSEAFVTATAEASVLARLWTERKVNETVDQKMRSRMDEYANVPGYPRLVHVLCTENRDQRFLRCLVMVLQDRTVTDSEIVGCIVEYREYIKRDIKVEELDLADSRRRIVVKSMSR